MRFYVSADIEGVAGVVSRETSGPSGFEYERARDWMTAEVVAACEAAFESGASEVVVSDSHGNGQNIKIDQLPDHVRIVRSWPRPLDMMQGIEDGLYEGAFLIGYHAGASAVDGIMAHTLHGLVIQDIKLNGQVISEAGLAAATAGHFNVPIIMASGDEAFCQEVGALLGDIELAAVKTSYSTLSAITLTPQAGRALIKEKVKAAIARRHQFRLYQPEPPLVLDIRFKHRRPAEFLSMLPIVERLSAYEIRFTAETMPDICKFLTFILFYDVNAI